MARAQQSFTHPVVAAITEGAVSPNPGTTNTVALSSVTGAFMRWTGTAWTAMGAATATSYASTMKYGTD